MPRTRADIRTTLSKAKLFSDLTEAELEQVARRVVARAAPAGTLIFSEGEPCRGLYVVRSGSVRIFKTSPGGREQVLAIEGPGSSIAELPVFDGGSYPASLISVSDAELLFLSKEDFQALCLQHPKVTLKVLREVGRRLRGLVSLVEQLSFATVRHRLAALLLRLAKDGKQSAGGATFELPAANHELAAEIGTVRELVSRNLSQFQNEGLIQLKGREVTIPDLNALRALLENRQ